MTEPPTDARRASLREEEAEPLLPPEPQRVGIGHPPMDPSIQCAEGDPRAAGERAVGGLPAVILYAAGDGRARPS